MRLFLVFGLCVVAAVPGAALRFLLLGKTGAGKSATANTLLNTTEFVVGASLNSVTDRCKTLNGSAGGVELTVTDTPGLFDTNLSEEEVKAELERCVEQSAPGPHVILLVVNLKSRFTLEEKASVEWIRQNFGAEALRFTIVAFTHADLTPSGGVFEYVKKSQPLVRLVNECGGRWISLVNDPRRWLPGQRLAAVTAAMRLVELNSGAFYTNDDYAAVQRRLVAAELAATEALRARRRADFLEMKESLRDAEWNKFKWIFFAFLGVLGAHYRSVTFVALSLTGLAMATAPGRPLV